MRIVLLCLLAAAMHASPAAAQHVYRCGKGYQDRPCDPESAIVHGPATVTPRPNLNDSRENQAARNYAEEERRRAYSRYQCASYDQDIRNVYDAQTNGRGSGSPDLNARARELEEQRRRAGCG